jgi:hypothetical protein
MNDRAQRAAARDLARQVAVGAVAGPVANDGDNSDDIEEVENPIAVPARGARRGAQAAAPVAAPLVMDPGMWLNMVNVKTPQLSDLEVESMKKFILDYKRYAQKCPRPLLRSMQQFILEDHLEIMSNESEVEMDDLMALERDEFIVVMVHMHKATSSRKWRAMVKKCEDGQVGFIAQHFCAICRRFQVLG